MIRRVLLLLFITFSICFSNGYKQKVGPDPWDYEITPTNEDINVPPDLRRFPRKKSQPESNLANGEWFFRRTMAIILKNGQNKNNEDGSIEISLQMKFESDQWDTLESYIKSNTPLTDEMFRRSIGYIEDAIYKPSFTEKLAMAWSDYIQIYLSEYKIHITWGFALLAAMGASLWLWKHMSHKHIIIAILMAMYLYEVFISYKEAEQQELDKFLAAIDSCKWQFWSSTCTLPHPDPIIFLKYMNPLKIGVRMFSNIVTEPMLVISSTIKVMCHGITDGLWYPFDKLVYAFMIFSFNILLVFMLIMIVFNFIFNIPFNLGILGISFGVLQRNRTFFPKTSNGGIPEARQLPIQDGNDRISGANLDRLLDVFTKALNGKQSTTSVTNSTAIPRLTSSSQPTLQRSASTGRLPNTSSQITSIPVLTFQPNLRKRGNVKFNLGGGGDA